MIQIDMPMPDNCLECRFNTSEFGYCNAMPIEFVGQVSDSEEDGKPEWCPLKAQEPRVMTLKEAQTALHNDTVVWVELKGKLICAGIHMDGTDYFTMQNDDVLDVTDFDSGEGAEVYGKQARCWTSRPTDEQREATPWN